MKNVINNKKKSHSSIMKAFDGKFNFVCKNFRMSSTLKSLYLYIRIYTCKHGGIFPLIEGLLFLQTVTWIWILSWITASSNYMKSD